MYQYKNGKKEKITMNVGTEWNGEYISDKRNKLVKFSKIEMIHLGKASKGLEKVQSPHNVCFSIIKKKTFGRETLDFEAKKASDRTDIILKIMKKMESFGLINKDEFAIMEPNVLSNEKQDEILDISLYPQRIAALRANVVNETIPKVESLEQDVYLDPIPEAQDNIDVDPISETIIEPYDQSGAQIPNSEWTVYWHTEEERKEIFMVVGSEVIIEGESEMNDVNLVEIQEIHLWNGLEGYQDEHSPKNVSFSIVHYKEETAGWETLNFEMGSQQERVAIITDITYKMELLGVYREDGLPQQSGLDSMGLEETQQIRFVYYGLDDTVIDQDEQDPNGDAVGLDTSLMEEQPELEQQPENHDELMEQMAVLQEKYKEMERKYAAEMATNQDLKNEMNTLREESKSEEDETRKLLEEMKVENEKQQKDLNQQGEAIQKLQDERKVLETMNHNLESGLSAERKQMDVDKQVAESEIERLKANLSELRGEMTAHQLEMVKVQTDSAKTGEALRMMRQDLDTKIKENDSLQQQMDIALQGSSVENEQFQSILSANKEKITELSRSNHELQNSLSAKNEELVAQKELIMKQEVKFEQLGVEQKEYMEQLAATEERYNKLHSKYKSQQKRNEEQRNLIVSDRDETTAIITRLNAELNAIRSELEEQRTQNAAQRKELDQRDEAHEKLMSEQEIIKNENETLQKAISGLHEELALNRTEIDSLSNRTNTLHKDSSTEIRQLRSKVYANKMEFVMLKGKIGKLQVSISEKDKELMKQREELERASKSTGELRQKWTAEKEKNVKLSNQMNGHLEETDSKVQALESDLEDNRRDLEGQRAQKEEYQHKHAVMEGETRRLQEELAAEIVKGEAVRNEMSDLREQLALSQRDMEHVQESSKANNEQLSEENENLTKRLGELQDSITEKDGELKKQRENLERESVTNEQLQQNNAVLEKENHDLKQELSMKIEKSETLRHQMALHQEEADEEIQRLKSDLDDSRRELVDLVDQQMEMKLVQKELVMKHKKSIETKEAAISQIEEKNDKLEADLEKLNEKNRDLQNSSSTTNAELVAEKELVVTQQAEYEELSFKQRELMQQLADKEKQYYEMEHKYEAETKARRALQGQMVSGDEAVMTEFEQLKSDLDEQREENEMQRQRLASYQKDMNQLREDSREKTETLNRKLRNEMKENDSLKQQINTLRQKSSSEIERLKAHQGVKIQDYKKEKELMASVAKEHEARIDELESAMDETSSALREQRSQNEVQRKELNQRTKEYKQLLAEQVITKKEKDGLQQKWTTEMEKNEALMHEEHVRSGDAELVIRGLKADLEDARTDLEGLKRQIERQRVENDRLDQKQKGMVKKFAAAEEKWNDTRKLLTKQNEAVAKLQDERMTMNEKNQWLQQNVSDEMKKNDALRKEMNNDRETANSEIENLKCNLNALRAELTTNQTNMDKAKTDSAKAMKQLKMAKDDLLGKYQKLEEERNGKMKENENLKNEISSEIERLQSELDANQMTIDKLKRRNAKLKESALATGPALMERDDLMQQLAATEVRCYGMEQKFDAQRKVNQDLKEQMAIEREKNEMTNNRLKSDLDITRSELEEQRTQNEIQRNEIEQQSDVYNRLMREKVMLEEQNEEQHQQRITEMEKNEILSDQMDAVAKEHEARIHELESAMDETHSALGEQRSQNEVQRKELNQRLKPDLDDSRKELAAKQTEMDQQTKSFEEHNAEYQGLLKRLQIRTLSYHAMKKQYDKETEINMNLRNQLFMSTNGQISEPSTKFKEQRTETEGKDVDRLLDTVWRSLASPSSLLYEHIEVGGFSNGEEVREMPHYEDLMEKQREILQSSNSPVLMGSDSIGASKNTENEMEYVGNVSSGYSKILRFGDEVESSVRHPAFSKAEPDRKSHVVTLKMHR